MIPPGDSLGLSPVAWEALAREWGLPPYRGRQIFDALHRRRARDYASLSELPKNLRERLADERPIRLPEIARRETAADGSVKYVLRLEDGALVEAVYMPGDESRSAANEFDDARLIPMGRRGDGATRAAERSAASQSRTGRSPGHSPSSEGRYTVCLSSQTGCAVDCVFCVTGRLGGGRNLTAAEIVGQLYAVLDDAKRSTEGLRLVFMGMGEPFLNPEGVLGALDVLFEEVSPRRVTVSTSGITPAFTRFAALPRRPNLAVSINAPDGETRARLMPITRTYPLEGLIEAMRSWPLEPRRRILVEYVLIRGENDAPEAARKLVRLLSGLRVKVNVIPLNEDPVHLPGLSRPSEEVIERFVKVLADAGLTVTVRRSKGPDVAAACGQLKGRAVDPRKRSEGRRQ